MGTIEKLIEAPDNRVPDAIAELCFTVSEMGRPGTVFVGGERLRAIPGLLNGILPAVTFLQGLSKEVVVERQGVWHRLA